MRLFAIYSLMVACITGCSERETCAACPARCAPFTVRACRLPLDPLMSLQCDCMTPYEADRETKQLGGAPSGIPQFPGVTP